MPLLLRKSAPSPSVDELSFAKRPLPLAPSSDAPRCLMHASSRSSLRRLRRSSESTSDNNANEASAVAAESEDDASATTTPRCTCGPSRRSSQGSRKRFSAKLEESDTLDPQRDTEEDGSNSSGCSHDRDSTCNKCARHSGEESSVYDSDDDRSVAASDTSSKVVIRDTQLAVVDVELKNLRKTFVKTIYAKLTQMSRRLGRRNGADTKRITSS